MLVGTRQVRIQKVKRSCFIWCVGGQPCNEHIARVCWRAEYIIAAVE
jgi:hypothetical protein